MPKFLSAPVKFEPGQIVMTRGIASLTQDNAPLSSEMLGCLSRHLTGDWGDVCDEDKAENELSLREGFRLLSAYTLSDGTKIWIITEADRSSTTVLLPDEY